MSKIALPDFSGKTISMLLIDEAHSHDLDNPHFEYQGERLFIIGTIPAISTDSGWNGNQIGAVAWELVRNYTLFPNLEIYTKAVEKSDSYQDDKK